MLKSTDVSVTQDLPQCSHTIETYSHINTRVSNQFNEWIGNRSDASLEIYKYFQRRYRREKKEKEKIKKWNFEKKRKIEFFCIFFIFLISRIEFFLLFGGFYYWLEIVLHVNGTKRKILFFIFNKYSKQQIHLSPKQGGHRTSSRWCSWYSFTSSLWSNFKKCTYNTYGAFWWKLCMSLESLEIKDNENCWLLKCIVKKRIWSIFSIYLSCFFLFVCLCVCVGAGFDS